MNLKREEDCSAKLYARSLIFLRTVRSVQNITRDQGRLYNPGEHLVVPTILTCVLNFPCLGGMHCFHLQSPPILPKSRVKLAMEQVPCSRVKPSSDSCGWAPWWASNWMALADCNKSFCNLDDEIIPSWLVWPILHSLDLTRNFNVVIVDFMKRSNRKCFTRSLTTSLARHLNFERD